MCRDRKLRYRQELKRRKIDLESSSNESTSKKQKKRGSILVPFKDESVDSTRTRINDNDELNEALVGLKLFSETLLDDLEMRSQNMMMRMKKELQNLVVVDDNNPSPWERKKNAGARFEGRKTHGRLSIKKKSLENFTNANDVFEIAGEEKEENSRSRVGPDIKTCLYHQAVTSISLMQLRFAQTYFSEPLPDQSSNSGETKGMDLIVANYNKFILESKKEERNINFDRLNSASNIQRSNPIVVLDQVLDSSARKIPLSLRNRISGKKYNSGVSKASQAITLAGVRSYAADNLARLNSFPNSKP